MSTMCMKSAKWTICPHKMVASMESTLFDPLYRQRAYNGAILLWNVSEIVILYMELSQCIHAGWLMALLAKDQGPSVHHVCDVDSAPLMSVANSSVSNPEMSSSHLPSWESLMPLMISCLHWMEGSLKWLADKWSACASGVATCSLISSWRES